MNLALATICKIRQTKTRLSVAIKYSGTKILNRYRASIFKINSSNFTTTITIK